MNLQNLPKVKGHQFLAGTKYFLVPKVGNKYQIGVAAPKAFSIKA
jgi:hypothetical protein